MRPDRERAHALARRLRWTLVKPLANRPNGDERSRMVGPGVEFAAVREYQPGDDVRRIDWNLTARLHTPYVREAQVEGAIDVWLVVDVSGSVDWGTAACLKRYRAIELAAITAHLLGRHGNRLGLLLFADRPVALVPPGRGRLHVERVVGTLRLHPRSTARGVTDLAAALESLERLARRPSLVVLATDFLVPEGWAAAAARAAQLGVQVNTIGIGTRGQQVSLNRQTRVGLDETTLKSIASTTGGQYFYAEDAAQLEQVYGQLGSQIQWVQEQTEVTLLPARSAPRC